MCAPGAHPRCARTVARRSAARRDPARHRRHARPDRRARRGRDRARPDAPAADLDLAQVRRGRVRERAARPPVRFDKGAGIASFLEGTAVLAALYAGDDATDLDAFRGLSGLVRDGRLEIAVRVAVRSDEGPAELAAEADVLVDGTDGVL